MTLEPCLTADDANLRATCEETSVTSFVPERILLTLPPPPMTMYFPGMLMTWRCCVDIPQVNGTEGTQVECARHRQHDVVDPV